MINKTETNETITTIITTYEGLVESDICMMFFARGCTRKKYARGLCSKHYHMILSRIRAGSLTWDKIETQLKALPRKRESFKGLIED